MEPPLSDQPENEAIPLPYGPISIGFGAFELPECPRCFLGYGCSTHGSIPKWSLSISKSNINERHLTLIYFLNELKNVIDDEKMKQFP